MERDIGTINTVEGMEDMAAAVGRASLERDDADFAVEGEARCGCLERATCAT